MCDGRVTGVEQSLLLSSHCDRSLLVVLSLLGFSSSPNLVSALVSRSVGVGRIRSKIGSLPTSDDF